MAAAAMAERPSSVTRTRRHTYSGSRICTTPQPPVSVAAGRRLVILPVFTLLILVIGGSRISYGRDGRGPLDQMEAVLEGATYQRALNRIARVPILTPWGLEGSEVISGAEARWKEVSPSLWIRLGF